MPSCSSNSMCHKESTSFCHLRHKMFTGVSLAFDSVSASLAARNRLRSPKWQPGGEPCAGFRRSRSPRTVQGCLRRYMNRGNLDNGLHVRSSLSRFEYARRGQDGGRKTRELGQWLGPVRHEKPRLAMLQARGHQQSIGGLTIVYVGSTSKLGHRPPRSVPVFALYHTYRRAGGVWGVRADKPTGE